MIRMKNKIDYCLYVKKSGGYGFMYFYPNIKNPLIASVTATLFLVGIRCAMLAVAAGIYFFLVSLIFFYYGSRRKR